MNSRRVWQRTAETWVQKTAARLRRDAQDAPSDLRWLIGYDASEFVRTLVWEAETLIPLIDVEQLEDLKRRTDAVARRVRDRILAEKLSGTAGRTPEEAAAFRAKADELRSRS